MIEETDTGPYPNVLGGRYLGGVVGVVLWRDRVVGRGKIFVEEEVGVWEMVEGTAIEGEGDLDFGFVGCAVDEGGAAVGHRFGGNGRTIQVLWRNIHAVPPHFESSISMLILSLIKCLTVNAASYLMQFYQLKIIL